MTLEDRETLKNIIFNDIKQTQIEIEELRDKIKPISPENSLGRLTRLEAIGEKSVNEAMLLKCEQRLKKLLYVKDRVEEPTFGVCNICDEPINMDRLKIVPESTVCIECAQLIE